MKTLLLILFFIFSIFKINAQPQITSSVLPILGDSIALALDTVLKSEGGSGFDVVWNFTNLKPHYKFKRYYVAPSSTPYSSLFSSSTLVRTDYYGSVYTYWKNSTNSSIYYGFVQPGILDQSFKRPFTYYKFPIKYQDNFTDTFTAVTNPGAITGNGKYSFNADAWGFLFLPNKSFYNVLRTKSVMYIGDSTKNSYSLTTEFAWYENGHKEPVLLISKVVVNKVLTKKFIIFDNSVTGSLQDLGSVNYIKLFPNPTTNFLSISIDKTVFTNPVSVKVFNVLGEKIFESSSEINSPLFNLDVLNFDKGNYFMQLSNNQNTSFIKFVKE